MTYYFSNLRKWKRSEYQSFYKVAMISLCMTILFYVGCVNTQAQKLPKKLIEFGWDVPAPAFVKQNIQQMEKRPFDGIVVSLKGAKNVFLHKPYDLKDFTQDFENLQTTNFSKFKDNFVLIWGTTEEEWDWFSESDWQATEQNIHLFAKAARAGKFVGIVFDPESYGVNPWIYVKLPSAKDKSFEEYWQQVRKRGIQFMQVLQQELPGVKVLSLFQLSYLSDFLDEPDPKERIRQLSTAKYGLLAPFLNGMLDVAQPNTRLVDGNERSYYYTDKESFFESYNLIKEKVISFVDSENRSKYALQVQVGQALYIDQLFAIRQPPEELLSYHLTPQERAKWLEHNTYYALSTTDEYVWCYSEEMNWWKNNVPDGVEEAIRSARQKINMQKPLGFNIQVMIQKAKIMQKAKNMMR
jgi:hypothetical protein